MSEGCLHRGLSKSDGAALQLSYVRYLSIVSPSNSITQQAAETNVGSPAVSRGKFTFLLDFRLSAN